MKPPETTAGSTQSTSTISPPVHGDYLCSERDLYYVEQVGAERVVLEDCRTGMLLDLSITDITTLRPITPASTSA